MSGDRDEFRPGDFYEDCRYHPMVCVEVLDDEDELTGIDLLTGALGSAVSPTAPREALSGRGCRAAVKWAEYVREHQLESYEPAVEGWNPVTTLPYKPQRPVVAFFEPPDAQAKLAEWKSRHSETLGSVPADAIIFDTGRADDGRTLVASSGARIRGTIRHRFVSRRPS